jgi:glycosyltransferase involved in cell wall biosynthesis
MGDQKRLYIHFSGRFPFPVNTAFFGNTFVIGSHTICSRLNGKQNENIVTFKKNKNMQPLFDEPHIKSAAQRLAKGRFNSDLIFDYESVLPEEMATLIADKVKNGLEVVLVSHYPISDEIKYLSIVREELKRRNLLDNVVFVAYLHTQMDICRKGNGKSLSLDSLVRLIGETCDAIIAVSDAVKNSFIEAAKKVFGINLDERVATIRNGIDPITYSIYDQKLIDRCREEVGLAKGLKMLLSVVGRLDEIKGSDVLLDIIKHFENSEDRRDADIGFIIATSHVLMPEHSSKYFRQLLEMKRLIREGRLRIVLDISKFIRRDERYRGDVKTLMHAFSPSALAEFEKLEIYGGMTPFPVQAISDALLQPSRTEGLPLSILEALFSGAYVIGSAVGGIPEVITIDTGVLLPPPNDLINVVPQYIDVIRKCAASNVRRRPPKGLERFTDIVMFEKFESAVDESISEKKRGGL